LKLFLLAFLLLGESLDKFVILGLEFFRVLRLFTLDLLFEVLEVRGSLLQSDLAHLDCEGLNTSVVDVMSLVKNDDIVAGEVLGNHRLNLRVQQILIVVHDDIGPPDVPPGQKIRTEPLLLPELFQVL
jgi:hypothetical protein